MSELSRRARLGARVAAGDGVVAISGVEPGSMAEAAGLEAGDELVAIGGVAIATIDDLAAALRQCGGLEAVAIEARRGGAVHRGRAAVEPAPLEPPGDREVEVGQLEVGGGVRLRAIATRPAGLEPRAAVLILPGIALESIELGAEPSLIAAIVAACTEVELATLRVERRGVGDSEGGPAGAVDFHTEVADVRAALAAIAARFDRAAIVGHSLGGMIAPLVGGAAAALAVYGTSSLRWYDCVDASARRQLADRGAPPVEIEAAIAAARASRASGASDDDRCAAFHAQLDASDIAGAWSALETPALIAWGDRDRVVSRAEAAAIADLAPDARLEIAAGLDHLGAPDPRAIAVPIARWLAARLC